MNPLSFTSSTNECKDTIDIYRRHYKVDDFMKPFPWSFKQTPGRSSQAEWIIMLIDSSKILTITLNDKIQVTCKPRKIVYFWRSCLEEIYEYFLQRDEAIWLVDWLINPLQYKLFQQNHQAVLQFSKKQKTENINESSPSQMKKTCSITLI